MALVGLRMMSERGKDKPVETGVLRLDEKTDQVVGEAKNEKSPVNRLLKRGVEVYRADERLAQTIGRKYNIAMPKPSEEGRVYTSKNGPHFLVAVMTVFSRSSYSWVEPIEE
jgi:hypothetical protein